MFNRTRLELLVKIITVSVSGTGRHSNIGDADVAFRILGAAITIVLVASPRVSGLSRSDLVRWAQGRPSPPSGFGVLRTAG